MGNAFYDLPAQNPRVPVFSLLGHSEHFWLLPTEPKVSVRAELQH